MPPLFRRSSFSRPHSNGGQCSVRFPVLMDTDGSPRPCYGVGSSSVVGGAHRAVVALASTPHTRLPGSEGQCLHHRPGEPLPGPVTNRSGLCFGLNIWLCSRSFVFCPSFPLAHAVRPCLAACPGGSLVLRLAVPGPGVLVLFWTGPGDGCPCEVTSADIWAS